MRAAYDEVIRWVRVHAWCSWRELDLLQRAAIGPLTAPLLDEKSPRRDGRDDALAHIEALTTAAWFLDDEHTRLMARIQELFGPKSALDLPASIASHLDEAARDPVTAIAGALSLLDARLVVLDESPALVDAHTRLVLRAHALIVRELVHPAVAAVLEALGGQARPESGAALAEALRATAPPNPRPHPDKWLDHLLLGDS